MANVPMVQKLGSSLDSQLEMGSLKNFQKFMAPHYIWEFSVFNSWFKFVLLFSENFINIISFYYFISIY